MTAIATLAPKRLALPRVNRRGHVLTHAPACPRCGGVQYVINLSLRPPAVERELHGALPVWMSDKPPVACRVCGHGFEGFRIRADGVIDLLVPIHDGKCTR